MIATHLSNKPLRIENTMTNDTQQFLPLGDAFLPQIKSDQDWIEEVLSGFDFPKVQAAMRAMGWSYFGEPDAPSIEALQAKARSLLEEVIMESEEGIEHQSGGFRASWYPSDAILLTFVAASASACKYEAQRVDVTAGGAVE